MQSWKFVFSLLSRKYTLHVCTSYCYSMFDEHQQLLGRDIWPWLDHFPAQVREPEKGGLGAHLRTLEKFGGQMICGIMWGISHDFNHLFASLISLNQIYVAYIASYGSKHVLTSLVRVVGKTVRGKWPIPAPSSPVLYFLTPMAWLLLYSTYALVFYALMN